MITQNVKICRQHQYSIDNSSPCHPLSPVSLCMTATQPVFAHQQQSIMMAWRLYSQHGDSFKQRTDEEDVWVKPGVWTLDLSISRFTVVTGIPCHHPPSIWPRIISRLLPRLLLYSYVSIKPHPAYINCTGLGRPRVMQARTGISQF